MQDILPNMYTCIVLLCFPGSLLHFPKDRFFHSYTICPISPTTIEIIYMILKWYGFAIVLIAERVCALKNYAPSLR